MVNEVQVFKYDRIEREVGASGKTIVSMGRSDVVRVGVQYVKEGGDNNLHSHDGVDGFWMVLGGRATFYGEGDQVLAELGKDESILIPRGTRYWFETSSAEPLEILHVAATALGEKTGRVDHESLRPHQTAGGRLSSPGA